MNNKKAALRMCWILAILSGIILVILPEKSDLKNPSYIVAMVFIASIFIIIGLSPDKNKP